MQRRKRFPERDPVNFGRAKRMVDMAQSKAATVLIEALEAMREQPRITGRDAKGAPIYEYVEVPDHHTRVKAAQILLNKRMPDLQKTEMNGELKFTPLKIIADAKNA